mgnify:FL=1
MITKPSNIGRWIGAAIATIILVAVSFVGFRAFNARAHANAELQSGAQSPQSDTAAQSGTQSGDAPQSAQPTPVDVPKPTPPKGLQEGGQVGAQTTALWFVELWEYAFNTGDTEEFDQICQDGDFCIRFSDEVKSLRKNSVVIQPLEDTIIPNNTRSYDCYRKDTGIFGVCVELSISERAAIVQSVDSDDTSREYTTIHTEKSDGMQKENKLSLHLFITEQDDHSYVISGFLLQPTENA